MTDVALLSLGTTLGLRRADDALAELIEAAGASCRMVRVRFGATGKLRRQITVIDLVEGLAARRAQRATEGARALIVSSATTSLLLQRPRVPWAIRFDSPTALNRTGVSGLWQRTRERQVFAAADLLLPWGEAAAQAAAPVAGGTPMVRLPVSIDVPAAGAARRSGVVAYVGWMWKRGLDLLCEAWAQAGGSERLTIGGCDRATGVAWLVRRGIPEPPGIEWVGALPRDAWLERVGRARAFVNASRREDHGLAQLEALALGTPLVTVPSPGAYEALPIARRLAPGLVATDVSGPALATALTAGLTMNDPSYAVRAAVALEPYRRQTVLATVRDEVLPALGVA
ncbi:MAG TPA: glycosyltransferase [Solirubrobacteraceae bacterium]|nr:glycosyltransferase [Solirubrobacteraceae bacterium]